ERTVFVQIFDRGAREAAGGEVELGRDAHVAARCHQVRAEVPLAPVVGTDAAERLGEAHSTTQGRPSRPADALVAPCHELSADEAQSPAALIARGEGAAHG